MFFHFSRDRIAYSLEQNHVPTQNVQTFIHLKRKEFFFRFVQAVSKHIYKLDLPTTVTHYNRTSLLKTAPSERQCQVEKYILLLKTHKTGSSTVTNIINRYADKYNLSTLLPKDPTKYTFDWPNKFLISSAVNTHTRPNVLANHARYNRKSMNILFPRETTTYISVLRHPVSQWGSLFQYMSFAYILNIRDEIDSFLEYSQSIPDVMELARSYPSLYLIQNPSFFDLGYEFQQQYGEYEDVIRSEIKILDEDFDIVLILEHFDESLTLLRRRLCWDIDDVVYFKLNERPDKYKRHFSDEISNLEIRNMESC